MAFRSSVGDNAMEEYQVSTDKTLVYLIWVLIMIVGNVVFMNFIIAVVNESYENCMTKMIAQSFKVKIDMIIEREAMMSEDKLNNPQWFPNYIVLRKKANGATEGAQWQGYVKEIRMSIDRSALSNQ